jgi:hypothetical protein
VCRHLHFSDAAAESKRTPPKQEIPNKDAPMRISRNVPITYPALAIIKTRIEKAKPLSGWKRERIELTRLQSIFWLQVVCIEYFAAADWLQATETKEFRPGQ